jgi:hypothetical protein
MGKPKIYAFSNVVGGGDGIAIALADDGTVLGSHWCSNEFYVPHDLGVIEGSRPDRHETYAKHFPGGYEMEFVRAADVKGHAGITAALKLNQEKAPPARRQPPVCRSRSLIRSVTAFLRASLNRAMAEQV